MNAPLARAAPSAVRPGQRAGFAVQDLQVVVQEQVLAALVQAAGVLGDDPAGDPDGDGEGLSSPLCTDVLDD